jgi:hypothetical protein
METKPTRGIAACCAQAMRGLAIAAPTKAMNFRRPMRNMKACQSIEPAQP